MTETDDQVSVLAMNKFTFVVSLLAGALGIALVLINIFDLSGRPPWIVLAPGSGDNALLLALVGTASWYLALSAAHRQFLFPASIQQPDAKAAPSAVPGAVDDLITRVVAQPGAPGFVLPDSYVDRDEYRDFTEKACLHVEFTYAVPLLPYLVNVGKTRDSRVPSRGRPNHYFFARFPGRDTDTVFEVPHNGRAGRGASANVCLVEGPLPIPAPALAGPAGA